MGHDRQLVIAMQDVETSMQICPSDSPVLSRLTGKTVDSMNAQQALQGLGTHTVSVRKGTGHKPQFVGRIAIHERSIVGNDPAKSICDRYGRLLAMM